MFLAIVSRPDIVYSIGVANQNLQNHTTVHWKYKQQGYNFLINNIYLKESKAEV